jgi:hypothetical protein
VGARRTLGVPIWDSRIAWHIFRSFSVPLETGLVLGGMVVVVVKDEGCGYERRSGEKSQRAEKRGFIDLLFFFGGRWKMVGGGFGRWDLAVSGAI